MIFRTRIEGGSQQVFVSYIIARYRAAEDPTQLECKQNRNGGIGLGPGLAYGTQYVFMLSILSITDVLKEWLTMLVE